MSTQQTGQGFVQPSTVPEATRRIRVMQLLAACSLAAIVIGFKLGNFNGYGSIRTEGIIYSSLVGSLIVCGILFFCLALWQWNLLARARQKLAGTTQIRNTVPGVILAVLLAAFFTFSYITPVLFRIIYGVPLIPITPSLDFRNNVLSKPDYSGCYVVSEHSVSCRNTGYDRLLEWLMHMPGRK